MIILVETCMGHAHVLHKNSLECLDKKIAQRSRPFKIFIINCIIFLFATVTVKKLRVFIIQIKHICLYY